MASGVRCGAALTALTLFTTAAFAQEYAPHIEQASDEGRAALRALELAEGIEADLFAEEPMLANPVCLYVDFDGGVYVGETFRHFAGVTDMRDHMDWLDEDIASRSVEDRLEMIRAHEGEDFDTGYGVEHERLRLIRDTDGDGVADSAVVFADGFNSHASGIGAGVLSYRGNVYYTCIPDLWVLRDLDGDGKSDERQVLSTGYGVHIALLGHDLHGLRIGPDRRLYFSCGDRAFNVSTEAGVIEHTETGAVLRCNLDGSGLEVWHSGLRNPQELVFDEYGNLFTGDNNSDGGDQARWVNVVEGADSGWRYAYQWITAPVQRGPWNDEKLWYPPFAGQAAYIVPPIKNIGHGPSGLTYHPGTGLAGKYARHFFLCDFRGDPAYSGIHTFTTEPKGAFWEVDEVERFVWNTLVTDCDFGPDGRMYFTDWVAGWNKTGKGRVFRAFAPGADERARSTAELLGGDWRAKTVDELVPLLRHADMRVRQEAHFALADAGGAGVEALTAVAAGASDDELGRLARVHAIWALGIVARTRPDDATAQLRGLTDDGDAEVRALATRVLGDERVASASADIVARISDPAPRVRFFAAIAAGRLGATDAIAPLVQLLVDAGEDDRNLRHAGIMGLLGCTDERTLAELYDHASPHVRTAVVVALRRRRHADVACFLHDAEDSIVLEAARAIHDVPIDAALSALAGLDIPASASDALARRVLSAALRTGAADRLALAARRADLGEAIRREAIDLLAAWSTPGVRDRVSNAPRPYEARPLSEVARFAPEIADAFEAGDGGDALFPAFARLVVATEQTSFEPLLRAWCEDTDRSAPARIAALSALEALGSNDLVAVVRVALGDADGLLRAAALDTLERLSPGEALPSLRSILDKGETAERRVALRILARAKEASADGLLAAEADKLVDGVYPGELALDLVLAVEARDSEALTASTARWSAPRIARDGELAPWLASLYGGDVERGRDVFQRVDLSCVRCHASGEGEAVRIGPDLTGVATRLSRLQILESIVAPNRRTTPGFAGTVLFLTDGKIANGRVVAEDEHGITLLDADGGTLEIARDAIDERRPDLSAMPEDLAASLTRPEMRDLLAYLASL